MKKALQTERLASFALNAKYEDLDTQTVQQLKIHFLDAVASLIHSLDKPVVQKLIRQLKYFKNTGSCRVPLLDKLPVDRAAQLYTALIRYPDFMDNYLGKHATCHPSDNIGALLAVGQLRKTSGKEFLLAMAVAYQVECRLIEEIPVMEKGFDHSSLLFSIAAGAASMQQYTKEQIAHALAISGVTFNPLITTRAAPTPEWKGFLSSFAALGVINILMLAKEGMTGPLFLFEGPQGYKQIHKMTLDYNWEKESFDLIKKCILKKYNAEVHSQSCIEAVLELRKENVFKIADIKKIEVVTFLTCYHIIGGGEYGDRLHVSTKEEADHSLPYIIAAALLDGEVMPAQFTPERIARADIQELIKKVDVHTKFPLSSPRSIAEHLDSYTIAYPDKLLSKVIIHFNNGESTYCKKEDYHGFFTRPLGWDDIVSKFLAITDKIISSLHQQRIIEAIDKLEKRMLNNLIDIICKQ